MLLREDQVAELKVLFDLFDHDGDGYLECEEVGALWAACGTVLTEAEVLDLVTELKPSLRKLPFDEFMNMMCRPMVDTETLEQQLRSTFPKFAGGKTQITATSLANNLAELGRPVDPLVAEEMINEAEGGDGTRGVGKVSMEEYRTMLGVSAAGVEADAAG
jgi:Ca2+-binding EF-hand superfamily protein